MAHATQVKCADCGYLAIRNVATRELMEVEADARETGQIFQGGSYVQYYQCFARVFDLQAEMGSSPGIAERKTVANNLRSCPRWTPWKQGFTPKEHQEALDRHHALRRQQQRDADDRRWRDGQAAKANRGAKLSLAVAIAGIVVAGLVNLYSAWLNRQTARESNQSQVAAPAVPPTAPR